MKRIIVSIIAVLMSIPITLTAQDNSKDLLADVPVKVFEPEMDIDGDVSTVLYNRLSQAVSLNGLASVSDSYKFALVPIVTIVSEDVTESVPPQYLTEVEIALYFADMTREVVLATEVINKKGFGTTLTKSVHKALSSLQARDPKIKNLFITAKKRIDEYYRTECETIAAKIEVYLNSGMLKEALVEYNAIPKSNVDCYNSCSLLFQNVSDEEINNAKKQLEENPDVSWIKN